MPSNFNGRLKNKVLASRLGEDYKEQLIKKYIAGQSCEEISEWIFDETKVPVGIRSIQRWMKQAGVVRTIKESFNLAIKRGRVKYNRDDSGYNGPQRRKLSYDERLDFLSGGRFQCVRCGVRGNFGNYSWLDIDHVVPLWKGGADDNSNRQILCCECHNKKSREEAEERRALGIRIGGMSSGVERKVRDKGQEWF